MLLSPSQLEERVLLLEDVDKYLGREDPPDLWLIEGLLPVYGRMLLVGDAKIGKSVLALQLAFCLASGYPFLGFHVPAPINVVYLQYEMRRRVFKPRVERMRPAFPPSVRDRLRFAVDHPDVIKELGYSYRDIPLEKSLSDLGNWPDLVVIDPLIYWLEGDENSNTEMRDFLLGVDKIAENNFGMVIVHHTHKPYRGQINGQSQSRGASSLPGWTESNLVLNRASGNDKKTRRLSFEIRAAAELDDLELVIDPTTLLFQRKLDPTDELTPEAILELASALDPEHTLSRRALIKEIAARYDLSEGRVQGVLERAGWEGAGRPGRPRKE